MVTEAGKPWIIRGWGTPCDGDMICRVNLRGPRSPSAAAAAASGDVGWGDGEAIMSREVPSRLSPSVYLEILSIVLEAGNRGPFHQLIERYMNEKDDVAC